MNSSSWKIDVVIRAVVDVCQRLRMMVYDTLNVSPRRSRARLCPVVVTRRRR